MIYKKGSHVGIVLSFVIFVGFLIFLYTILEPSLNVEKDKQALLSNLKVSLLERFSEEMTIFTIIIDDNATEDCIELENFMQELPGLKIISKNATDGFVRDTKISNDENNLYIDRYDNMNKFFKIYHSSEFSEVEIGNIAPCKIINNDSYSIESVVERDEIFFQMINKTKIEYEDSYDGLKTELEIPISSEFGFSFTDKESILIETEQVNISTSVYAEEISILYVDEEANINPGFIIIKVW